MRSFLAFLGSIALTVVLVLIVLHWTASIIFALIVTVVTALLTGFITSRR